MKLYQHYRALADKEPNVHFVGRLASYKYFNMDAAIDNALTFFSANIEPKALNGIDHPLN